VTFGMARSYQQHMRIVFAIVIFLMPAFAWADALTDLRTALAQLAATTPVRGSLDIAATTKSSDEDKPDIGKVTVGFESSDGGLHLVYPRALLAQADQEARGEAIDPERTTPARSGFARLRPLEVADLVDAAAALNVTLQNAQVTQSRPSNYHGKPARLVVLKVTPRLSKSAAKHMKKLESTLSLWLGDDGVPIGAERTTALKVSFLLLSFENDGKETWTYARAGDRLVASRYEETQTGQGFGQHTDSQITEVLTIQ
jgi:hypothetical protein